MVEVAFLLQCCKPRCLVFEGLLMVGSCLLLVSLLEKRKIKQGEGGSGDKDKRRMGGKERKQH